MAFNELTLIMLYTYANVLLSMCLCVCVSVFVECANVCLVCVFSLRSIEFFCGNWSNCNSQSWHRFVSWFTHSVLGPLLTSPVLSLPPQRAARRCTFAWSALLMKIQVQVGQVCVLSLLSAIRSSNQIESKQLLPLLLLFVVVASLCCCCCH